MLPSHGRSRGFESLVAHHPLLLIRHGETAWNREARFQGALDSDLTDLGRAQALAVGRVLAAHGVGPDTHDALTSPQGRAAETARLALAPLGFAARRDPRLSEIGMGLWAGLTRAEVAGRWPGPPGEALFDFYARCPGGEALEAVAARAAAVLAGLRRPAVVVTHGVTLRVLCALALGWPLAEGGRLRVVQGTVLRVAGGRLEVWDPADLPAAAATANRAGGG